MKKILFHVTIFYKKFYFYLEFCYDVVEKKIHAFYLCVRRALIYKNFCPWYTICNTIIGWSKNDTKFD